MTLTIIIITTANLHVKAVSVHAPMMLTVRGEGGYSSTNHKLWE